MRSSATPPAGEEPGDLLGRLSDLVARLRAPDGCPWDREQGLGDLRAYLLEEAHEVAAAIDGEDWQELAEELGDLLFQVAFILRLATEAESFSPAEVVAGVESKMVERHPHVFGGEELDTAAAVRQAWARRKQEAETTGRSILDGVAASVPALLAAYRLGQKAGDAGFDWQDHEPVLGKVREEIGELESELAKGGGDTPAIRAEIGDLLFAVANLARHLAVDPEAALAQANLKFRRRFRHIEQRLADSGRNPAASDLEEMEGLWQEAKRLETE